MQRCFWNTKSKYISLKCTSLNAMGILSVKVQNPTSMGTNTEAADHRTWWTKGEWCSFTTSKDVIYVSSLSPRNAASKKSKAAWTGQPDQPAQLQFLFSLLEPFAFVFPMHSLLFHSWVCMQQLPAFLVWALPKKRNLGSRCWWRRHSLLHFIFLSFN